MKEMKENDNKNLKEGHASNSLFAIQSDEPNSGPIWYHSCA